MGDVRARIKENALETVGGGVPSAVLSDLTEDELDAAIDALGAERLEFVDEHGGELYATSEVFRHVMKHRGVMVEHSQTWPDPRDVEEKFGPLSEETRERAEAAFGDAMEMGPSGYGELLDAYRTLTDGELADLTYLNEGDPVEGEDVRLVVEHADRRFETTLPTTDREVDVGGLVELLNEVLDATVDTDERFGWSNVHGEHTVGVWFERDIPCQMLDTYYQGALYSRAAKAQADTD